MTRGTIKRLVKDRGFGFIEPAGQRRDVFFHRSAMDSGQFDDLQIGEEVEFEIEPDPRDPSRNRAVHVRPVT